MSTNKNFDFRDYLNNCDYMGDVGRPMLTNRIETRTRQYDVTDALRFRVHGSQSDDSARTPLLYPDR